MGEKKLYEHTCFCCEHSFLSSKQRKIYFCATCLDNKKHIYAALQVKHNLRRVEKEGLPATLTVQEWITTLDDFSWQCAYCQIAPYSILEHFIPVNLGGSTTPDNILPSCRSCNCIKSFHHPSDIFPSNIIEHITRYLSRKHEVMA